MTPYYDDGSCVIYHGECVDVMTRLWSSLRTGSAAFDLLLADPPYGLNQGKHAKRGGAGGYVQKTGMLAGRVRVAIGDYGDGDWDGDLAHEAVAMSRSLCRHQIIFGGNYYDLPPASCWLVWDKDNGDTDFADCELAWTNLRKAVRKLTYRWNGMLQQPGVPREERQHPTQKPEAVMRWALGQAPPDVRTVLDPFMGSGTTLVAAKRLGVAAVGIEREERYCEIAAKRLAQGSLFVAGDDSDPEPSRSAAWPISGSPTRT
jgi:DNA modification methylase